MTSKLVMRAAVMTASAGLTGLAWLGGMGGISAADAAPVALIPVPCSAIALSTAITIAPPQSILLLTPGCV